MTDLAALGLRFETQGADRAEKALDNIAQKADRAERATDGLAGGSRRLSGATMQMLASIERAVQELVALQRAQQQFTIGLAEGAAAAVREAQALNTASGAMNTYAGSATKAAAAQSMVGQAQIASLRQQDVTWRQFVAARMGDYMRLEGSHGAAMKRIGAEWRAYKAGAEQAATATAQVSAAVTGLTASQNGAAQDRVNAEMREAAALYKAGAISAEQYAMSMRVLDERYRMVTTANTGASRAMNKTSLAAIDLSRQFADIGVTAAMGMNPLMILIQQGPQIADRLAVMKMEGVGLSAAMKGLWVSMAPLLPIFLAIAAVAGTVFGAAALAARAVNKDVGDLTKGLGLTEAQMKRLKDEGVETGVTIGDVFKGTFTYIAGAVGKLLEPVAKWFSKLFDDMTRWAVAGVKGIVGALVGGFAAIKAVWKQLPAVIGDVAVSAANAALNAIERMINRAIDGYNKVLPLVRVLMLATGNVGGAMSLREGKHVNWGDIPNPNAGAAQGALDAGAAAFKEGQKAGEGWVDGVGKGLKDAWLKAAEERIKAAAGDAGAARKAREPKGPKGPSAEDMAEQFAQRKADIERQLEQAKTEELQAQLALTVEIRERADIERQIARQQAAVKAAQLKAQLERIKADDKLTEAAKQELAAMLLGVAIIQGRVAQMQQDAITDQEKRDTAKEAHDIASRALDADVHVLQAQLDTARGYFARRDILRQIFAKEVEQRKLAIEHLKASKDAKDKAEAVARERELQADLIAEQRRREQEVLDGYKALRDQLSSVVDAFKRHDWVALVEALKTAIDDLRAAWNAKTAEGKTDWGARIGAVSSVAGIAGEAIGGTAGAVLSGGASGAMAGLTLAPLLGIAGPVGAIAGAILGGIFGGLGADKQKKAQKAEEERRRREEAARVEAERAQQARELEIMLMQESGNVLGALAAQRQLELDSIHPTNRALAEQVQALKAARAAQETYNNLFLSENERLLTVAQDTGKALAQLGFTGVTSMEQFKALADGIDRTTSEGAQLFSALMSLGPAFSQVAGYIASVQGAAAALTPYQAAQGRLTAARGGVTAAEARVAAAQSALQAAMQASVQNQVRANNQASQAAQRLAQQFRSLADSLSRYHQSLTSGSAAMLSPEEAYKQAKAAFDAIQGKTDAESLGQLQDVSEAYRDASEKYFGSSLAYFKDLERIKAAVNLGAQHADQQATVAEAQVAQLEAANQALNTINSSVLSVEDAQRELLLAEQALALAQDELAAAEAAFQAEELSLLAQIRDAIGGLGAQPATGGGTGAWNAESYLAKNPDVRDHWFTLTQRERDGEGVHTIEQWARKHWDGIGRSEGRQFATGGAFTNSIVQGPTAFPMGLMGEAGDEAILPLANVGGQLGVRATNDNGQIEAKLDAVVEAVKALIRQNADINTAEDGRAERVVEAVDGVRKAVRAKQN